MITQARSALRGRQLKTGQTTCYHVGDDGDLEKGLSKVYTVYTAGGYSGTTSFYVAHYAANTISFTAPATIADSASGLVTILTGDTVVITGSASNDGIYTVLAGGVAGSFTVGAAVLNEGAGAYVTIHKLSSISNNCVLDKNTGLMWLRNTTTGLKIGAASTGLLNWYDPTTVFTLHPAAADLQMTATGLKIVGGAGEINRYYVGTVIDCSGFANAVNNLPGYVISNIVVNGLDLDITLTTFNNTLIAEAAGGSRAIGVVCQSAFAYCAAANMAAIGGYSDWRIPNDIELFNLRDMEATTAAPDAASFPGWPTADYLWSSTDRPDLTTRNIAVTFLSGTSIQALRATAYYAALVRGGI